MMQKKNDNVISVREVDYDEKKNFSVLLITVVITCCAMSCKAKDPEEKGATVVTGISAGYFDSDGILKPMDAGELIGKLSRLTEGMAIEEVVGVFGKEPFTVIETGEDVYQYYCGDITITLWGKELYIVEVEYDESWIRLELHPEPLFRENDTE